MTSTESSIMAKERVKGNGKGIKIVRERYNDLNHLIGDLSAKLSEVSSSIDQEFLSAYRVHMVDVQEDLKTLKQQVRSLSMYNQAPTSFTDGKRISTDELDFTQSVVILIFFEALIESSAFLVFTEKKITTNYHESLDSDLLTRTLSADCEP